jgi:hypothetical protein
MKKRLRAAFTQTQESNLIFRFVSSSAFGNYLARYLKRGVRHTVRRGAAPLDDVVGHFGVRLLAFE